MKTPQKTFTEWLLKNYLLVFRDDENLKVAFSLRVNYARLFLALFVLVLVLSLPIFFITKAYISSSSRIEGLDSKRGLLELAIQIDSLELMLAENQRYYENFSGIINGQVKYEDLTPPKDDKNTNTETQNPEELDNIDVVDSQFRKSYEGSVQEDFGIGAQDNNGSLQRVMLFAPLRNSVVVKKYDLKEPHYGLDLAANKGSRIKAVADGTVLTASWTQDGGHVIAIQHSNDLVSFYKHNSELLHEVGDFVKAGEDIAIIGNSGEQTDGPHLHLELWYRGSPVNPEYFIAF